MTLQERLKKVRQELGLSVDALGKELTQNKFDISGRTIYGYETESRQPSVSFLTGLTTVFEINPFWLLTGNGEMFLNPANKQDYTLPENLNFNDIVFVPHVDLRVSAGYGALADEINMTQDFMAYAKNWLKTNFSAPLNELVIFTVSGDSMDCPNSQIKDGTLVMVDKSINEFKNDGIYVISLDGALFVKRLQILPKKMMRVKSDNPSYDPFDVSLEDDSLKIIGKVVWVGNKVDTLKQF